MSEDLRIELAKNEMVEKINEVITKYELPLTFTEIILGSILNEVSFMKKQKVEQELKEMESDKNVNEEN